MKNKGISATVIVLIVIVIAAVVAMGGYIVISRNEEGGKPETSGGSYPDVDATPTSGEYKWITIKVDSGIIPAGDWEYSISITPGEYEWKSKDERLNGVFVYLERRIDGNYYVSLRHSPTKHVYFSDKHVNSSYIEL